MVIGLALALLLQGGGGGGGGVAPTVVFRGRPQVKSEEKGIDRSVTRITDQTSDESDCVVARIGETYYWASRNNRILTPHEPEKYWTYIAEDGTGYIKIVK